MNYYLRKYLLIYTRSIAHFTHKWFQFRVSMYYCTTAVYSCKKTRFIIIIIIIMIIIFIAYKLAVFLIAVAQIQIINALFRSSLYPTA